METCQYFPKPSQILGYVHTDKTSKQYNSKFNIYSGYCQVCKKSDCITVKDNGSWQCRNCYTGLTDAQINEKYQEFYKILDKIGDM